MTEKSSEQLQITVVERSNAERFEPIADLSLSHFRNVIWVNPAGPLRPLRQLTIPVTSSRTWTILCDPLSLDVVGRMRTQLPKRRKTPRKGGCVCGAVERNGRFEDYTTSTYEI